MKNKNDLIKQSIEHYDRMIGYAGSYDREFLGGRNGKFYRDMKDAIKEDWGDNYCVLCHNFPGCKDCPLKINNKCCNYFDSSWHKMNRASTISDWIKYAKQMREDIRSCLSEPIENRVEKIEHDLAEIKNKLDEVGQDLTPKKEKITEEDIFAGQILKTKKGEKRMLVSVYDFKKDIYYLYQLVKMNGSCIGCGQIRTEKGMMDWLNNEEYELTGRTLKDLLEVKK